MTDFGTRSIEWAFQQALVETAAAPEPQNRVITPATAQAATSTTDAEDDLPSRLAAATGRTLGVPGAGLSLLTDEPLRRLPLGASSPQATLAEQLQFTTGQGPCLTAHRIGQPNFSNAQDMQHRWPAFHDLLRARTPFQAVASLPLRDHGRPFGALDLYLADDQALQDLDTFAAVVVASTVAEHLTLAAMLHPHTDFPAGSESGSPWFQGPAHARMLTWQAIGILTAHHATTTSDGLDRLRSHALAHDTTTDALSADLVAGRINPSSL